MRIRSTFLALAVLSYSNLGHTWGLSNALNDEMIETRLVTTVVRFNAIRYCVDVVDDPGISQKSLEIQTEVSLKIWLEPLKELGISSVQILKEPCDSTSLDLKVKIGKLNKSADPFSAAYYDVADDKKRWYSNVIINTEHIHFGQFKFMDFMAVFKKTPENLMAFLENISFERKMTTKAAALSNNVDPYQVNYTTFHIILHELGHAFGLCDTYKAPNAEYEKNMECQAEFKGMNHPDGIMKLSDRYYLMDDDKSGLLELFKRYKPKIKVSSNGK